MAAHQQQQQVCNLGGESCASVHIHRCTHTHMTVHMRTRSCMRTYAHTRTHFHARTHTRKHTPHTHTHTHTQMLMGSPHQGGTTGYRQGFGSACSVRAMREQLQQQQQQQQQQVNKRSYSTTLSLCSAGT